MIYVSEEQLDQVEYLIDQSIQGNHVLFNLEDIRRAFRTQGCDFFEQEEAYEVEHHIEKLITQNSLEEKRAYIEGLDRGTLNIVVRTYFNIIENNIYEKEETRH